MSTVDRPPAPYEQVATHVRSEIPRGRRAPGAGLPSVPRLAQRWDVSPATVGRAFGLLRGDGWIVTRPGKLTVVTELGTFSIDLGGGGNWDDETIKKISVRIGCQLDITPRPKPR